MNEINEIRSKLSDQFTIKEDVNPVKKGDKNGYSANLTVKSLISDSVENPSTGKMQQIVYPEISVNTIGMGETEEKARKDAYSNFLGYFNDEKLSKILELGNFEISETYGESGGSGKMSVNYKQNEKAILKKEISVSATDNNRIVARKKTLDKLCAFLGI